MNLTDKTAIVTGASSGIGAEFSKALAHKGATVYGLARRLNKLESLREELGDKFIPVQQDITRHQDVAGWVNKTFNEKHLPDVLVNNAGLGLFGNVDELSIEDWETMVNTNLSGTFYITRKVVPWMKMNEEVCHIINISSIAGKIGNPQISGYNATKFALTGFSEALFKELRYDGIKVTCLHPGSIATGFFERTGGNEAHPNMMMPPDIAKVLIDVIETPDNFLISDVTMRPLNPKPPEER